MKKIISIALVTLTTLAVRTACGQLGSPYFQAVTNLNPVVYFPLQDVFTPTWVNDVETNYGTLGQGISGQDDAVYESQQAAKGNGNLESYLDNSVFFSTNAGSFLAVPTTDTNTAVQSPALSVECWIQAGNGSAPHVCIVSKSGGGINGTANDAGWVLSQNYVAYLDSSSERGWDFHVFNGIGREGAEIIVPFNIIGNTTYHLVATFDGTNCRFYVNGVDMVAAGEAIQIPMPAGSHYVPDTWDPLCIGGGRGRNANLYNGAIGDVAIYTNALSAASVNSHYQAAFNGPNYDSAVAADNAYMFYHMDSQGYTPPTTTYTAASYGLDSANYVAVYGTAAVPDAPGPQYPGLLDPTLGNQSYGVQINGVGGGNGENYNIIATNPVTSSSFEVEDSLPINVMWTTPTGGTDSSGNPLLNPTNHEPFSVSCWFKGNPTDNGQFQNLFGHTDNGWRCAITTGAGNVHFRPGNADIEIASDFGFNDGNWHHLLCTYDGTNIENMYLDGRLSATASGNKTNVVGSADDVILGGDPQYINCGNPVSTPPTGVVVNGGNPPERDFSGAIAHFAFWTNALSAAQVENLYSNAVPNQAPYIIAQPVTGRTNPSPAFLFFATIAGGTPALGFQWYHTPDTNYSDGVALTRGNKYQFTSATNPANGTLQLVVSNLVNSDSGNYFCVITNYSGSVTTILASLSVNYAPVITAQTPAANFPLYSGQGENMSVTVSSATNGLVYQWYANGTPDPAGTNSTYLTAPQTTGGNQFYCIVTNSSGSATSMTVSVSQIISMPAVLTNSLFSSNILATGPTAYWPMNETGETPAAGDIETNYGGLGTLGTGIYGDWRSSMQAYLGVNQGGSFAAPTNMTILHGIPGAIAGDTDPAECIFDSDGSEIIVPHSSPQLTLVPPFTLEAWLRPNDNSGFGVAIGEHSGTFNATGNAGGFDWIYSGTSNTFSMSVYNGNGAGEGSEPKTSANYPPGQWYHVVTTYDGTNVQFYIDGVADPMTGANGTNGTYAQMAPNYWDPITIGCGRGLGANYWRGSMDEVAIYTNLLPVAEIQKHYADGTNATYHSYMADVLNDHPALYYRMDAPAWVPPATNTWPTLTNYGSVAINGYYTPNAVPSSGPAPSVDGVTLTGLPANSSFQSDGVMAFGDALNVPAFHPSGKTPFTVAAWMRGFPADDSARAWQGLVADGDSSWRLNLYSGTGRANFNNGGNGATNDVGAYTATGASITINDGQWHWVVSTCDGSNTVIYVDGLVSSKTNQANLVLSSQNVPVFLGAYPINNTSDASFPRDAAFEANSTGNGSGRVLAGDLCDAAFWNGKALTSNQISSMYQAMDVPPIIDVQPIPANANQDAGFTNVTLSSGTPPLSYQWYQNGSLRAGQTGPNLALSSVQPTDIATNNGYYLVVNNAYGSATSAVVTLTVNSVPSITQNLSPTNITVWAGAQLSYSVMADGAVPLYYQWFSNSVAITAASQTGSNIMLTAQPAGVTNNFYCIVTNALGSVTSYVAQVTILALPSAPYVGTIVADQPQGFWRLNEAGVNGPGGGPNNGVIAYDYMSGNNGIYTNAELDFSANNPHDTNASSVDFGALSFKDSDVFAIPNVNFSAPSGTNRNFSIECWAKGGGLQTADAGLVTKGYGGGGEQFILDCGSDGTTGTSGGTTVTNPYDHSFRFFVRNSSSNVIQVASVVNPQDQVWHHLVGVCNQSNGYVALYIDGQLVGTNTISPTAGILSSTRTMLIGSRPSNSTTNNNDDGFYGYMQDVAVYTYALSAQQVLNHYDASEAPALVIRQPTNTVASSGGSATFSITADGALPLGYQWWDVNANAPVNGGTSATLVLNGVTANDSYYCVATNAFGTNQSQSASLTVISGAPQLSADVQPQYLVFENGSISIPVTAYGTLPLSYQWLYDTNTVIQNNYRISGAASNVLTLTQAQLSDAGTYECIITNNYGAVTSTIASVVVASVPVNFNSNGVSGNGLGWSANHSGTVTTTEITNGVLVLTDNGASEARSFFFDYPQYIGAFEASFIYQVGGDALADGMSFCLQNDPRGASALGGDGGQLGVGTTAGTGTSIITPSWEVEFNFFQNADSVGYNVFTNGIVGVNVPIPGIDFTNGDNGDPIGVNLYYINGQMTMTFTDLVTTASGSTNFTANIAAAVGGQTAYVGFTGGDGGSHSTQTITDFSFISIPTAQIQPNSPNAIISWPNLIPGYTLQESSSLTSPNWVNVPNPVTQTNSMYEVTVPNNGHTEFYRLIGP